MSNFRTFKRRRKKNKIQVKLTHEYVAKSVEEYLKNGGKITRIEMVDGECVSKDGRIDFFYSADQYLIDKE